MRFLDNNFVSDTDMVSQYKDEMMMHCKTVSEWAEENKSLVQKQSAMVNEFWDRTYKVDFSTGATPKKKSYKYPKTLTRTIHSPQQQDCRVSGDEFPKENGVEGNFKVKFRGDCFYPPGQSDK